MGFNATQKSFTGGEISERAFGRIDLEQYQKSVRLMRNFKVLTLGGAFKRSGTVMRWETKDSTKESRLVQFEFSVNVGYILEFGENYIRFGLNGSLLESGGSPVEITTTYTEAEVQELHFAQSADVLWICHPNHNPRQLRRLTSDGLTWDFIAVTFIDGPYFPLNSTSTTIASSGTSGTVTLTASADLFASTDVGRHIRQFDSGSATWAWATIDAYTDAQNVTATIVENIFQTAATDKWKLGKYSDTTGWPKTVTFHEQRIGYAGSADQVTGFDLSQTDLYDWFQQQPDETLLDTDALGWILGGRKLNAIQWMIGLDAGLAIGTTGGAWIATGAGGKDDPMTPTSLSVKRQTSKGSSADIFPVEVGDAVLFVGKSGRKVYEFVFSWENDKFLAPDLTLFADHLTQTTTFVGMDSDDASDIVYGVLADGTIAALTYRRDDGVVAWHTHDTDGSFEHVASVGESGEDVVYVIVKRTINGVQKRFVESFASDFRESTTVNAFFVDCGITITNSPASKAVTGLSHLEAKAVDVLADGRVVPGLTVSSGSITLPFAASTIHVGLHYDSDIHALPFESETDNGSTFGKVKSLAEIAIKFYDSYGGKVGMDFDNLEEIIFNENQLLSTAPDLFSGEKIVDSVDGHPDTDISVCFRHDLPLPCTVTAIAADITVSEG